MSKKSQKPPSRAKYDESHPTVSMRVTREMYEELETLRLVSGKSLGDILREALDKQLPSTGEAYDSGYEVAKSEFAVTYKCCICGGNITLSSAEEKTAAAQYMREHRWGHSECHNKKKPG
jgi:hypothetical protein